MLQQSPIARAPEDDAVSVFVSENWGQEMQWWGDHPAATHLVRNADLVQIDDSTAVAFVFRQQALPTIKIPEQQLHLFGLLWLF